MANYTKKHLQDNIIHGYDSLSVDILWSIVVNHLQRLKGEVRGLLDEWIKD